MGKTPHNPGGRPAFSPVQREWLKRRETASRCAISKPLADAYRLRRLRRLCLRLALRLEGGPFFSRTVRTILERYHGARVGPYSYGAILSPGILPSGSVVGAYCSVGANLVVRRRNHPFDRMCQHPLFYNSAVGFLGEDTIPADEANPLTIGNDVWIGDSVIVLPGCRQIGDGAVVGAGAVVTRDVECYTIVAGNPARVLRRRYDEEIEGLVRASRWWTLPVSDLLEAGELLVSAPEREHMRKFCNVIQARRGG